MGRQCRKPRPVDLGAEERDNNVGSLPHVRKALLATLVALTVAIATFTGAPTATAAPSLVSSSAIYMNSGSRCTLGFVLPGSDGHAEGITAGHCGNVGDLVTNQNGVTIGYYVNSVKTNSNEDIARIRLRGDGLPTGSASTYVPFNGQWWPILGVMSPEELNTTRPVLCKVGSTTGQTCGLMEGEATASTIKFRAASDHGDSGSPIFAMNTEGVYAAGVLLGSPIKDNGVIYATPVLDFAKEWGVTVQSPGQ